jgi:hypothetical protein
MIRESEGRRVEILGRYSSIYMSEERRVDTKIKQI